MHSKTLTLLTLFAVLLGVVACGGGTTLTPAPMRTEAAPGPPVAVAVGGILCRLRPPSAADRPTGARPEQRPAGPQPQVLAGRPTAGGSLLPGGAPGPQATGREGHPVGRVRTTGNSAPDAGWSAMWIWSCVPVGVRGCASMARP
jgi:hypothetical protein